MRKLIEQLAKFSVVGFAAFGIDYGVLMLLSQVFGVDPVLSAGISFVVSVVFNYLASMRFVFTRRDDLSRSRELAIFVVLSVVGLLINEVLVWLGVLLAGNSALALTVTKVFATAVVMVWNFWSRKHWLEAPSE
jgi:putative flippase GtrA